MAKKFEAVDQIKRNVESLFDQPLTAGRVVFCFLVLSVLGFLWFSVGLTWNESHPLTYWWLLSAETCAGVGSTLTLIAGDRGTPTAKRCMWGVTFIGLLAGIALMLYMIV